MVDRHALGVEALVGLVEEAARRPRAVRLARRLERALLAPAPAGHRDLGDAVGVGERHPVGGWGGDVPVDVLVGRRGVHQLEAPLPPPAPVLQRDAFHLRKRRVVLRVPRRARGACGQRLEGVRPALAPGDAHRHAVPALGVGLPAPGGLAVGEDRDRGARGGHAPDEAPRPHKRGQLHRGLGELLVDVADQVVVALAALRVVQRRVALQPAVLGRPHR